jgi:hypothetical protein
MSWEIIEKDDRIMPKKDRIVDTTHLEKKRLRQWIILVPLLILRGPSWTWDGSAPREGETEVAARGRLAGTTGRGHGVCRGLLHDPVGGSYLGVDDD